MWYLCAMRTSTFLLVLIAFIAIVMSAEGQRSQRVTRSKLHFANPKVRGSKARIVCPTFDKGRYPLHGLGVKIGDPFALTYKFYPNKRFSVGVDVGKAASGLYSEYFRLKFHGYAAAGNLGEEGTAVSYWTHRVTSDFVADVRAFYYFDAGELTEGLRFYVGGGWEWKASNLEYTYEYARAPVGEESGDPFGSLERRRFTMGPQVSAGLEYAYFKIPVAAFMEGEYFTDVSADPGWSRFQGGVGLRYIF